MKIYGVIGGKDAGKTMLIKRLVAEITGRGLTVSTIQQAPSLFDADEPGKDSYRHRKAGAREVFLASSKRFALMHELREEAEPTLAELLGKLAPVDLILVEGYDGESHAKIKVMSAAASEAMMALDDPSVKAIASDTPQDLSGGAVFDLSDAARIADFILAEVGL